MFNKIFVLVMYVFKENIMALFVAEIAWNKFSGEIHCIVGKAFLENLIDGFQILFATGKMNRLGGDSFIRIP